MKLKEWREEVGRTVADVAEELGVTRQAVGNYERGRLPGADVLANIVRMTAGEVTPNDWLELHELAPLAFAEPDGPVRWNWTRYYRAGEKPPALTPAQEFAARMVA